MTCFFPLCILQVKQRFLKQKTVRYELKGLRWHHPPVRPKVSLIFPSGLGHEDVNRKTMQGEALKSRRNPGIPQKKGISVDNHCG